MHTYNTNGNQNRYAKDLKSKKKNLSETKSMQKKKNGVCLLFANYSWAWVPV